MEGNIILQAKKTTLSIKNPEILQTDQDQSPQTEDQRQYLKKGKSLFEEPFCRQSKTGNTGTDKEGIADGAHLVFGKHIHPRIVEGIGKKQAEKLQNPHVKPQDRFPEGAAELLPVLGGHAEKIVEDRHCQTSGRAGNGAQDTGHLSCLREIGGQHRKVLGDPRHNKAEKCLIFPDIFLLPGASICFGKTEQKKGKEDTYDTDPPCEGERHIEKEDPRKKRQNKGGLGNTPDDPVGPLLHGIGEQLHHKEIDRCSDKKGEAG